MQTMGKPTKSTKFNTNIELVKGKKPKRKTVKARYSFPEEDEILSSREKMELLDYYNDDI
jgi:hypothetical protein